MQGMRRSSHPWGRAHRFAASCVVGVLWLSFASSATGEEWYDAYGRGIKALKRGEADKAIVDLERAVRLRPEPGTNVVTYGTNWLGEYAPYLSLAEAYLLAGNPAKAKEALQRSEGFLREAADRRARLAAQVEAAVRTGAAPAAGAGRNADVQLLLVRSHLTSAQTALAAAAERDRGLSDVAASLSGRLEVALRELDQALAHRSP